MAGILTVWAHPARKEGANEHSLDLFRPRVAAILICGGGQPDARQTVFDGWSHLSSSAVSFHSTLWRSTTRLPTSNGGNCMSQARTHHRRPTLVHRGSSATHTKRSFTTKKTVALPKPPQTLPFQRQPREFARAKRTQHRQIMVMQDQGIRPVGAWFYEEYCS